MIIILQIIVWIFLALSIINFFRVCNRECDRLLDKSEEKKGDEDV